MSKGVGHANTGPGSALLPGPAEPSSPPPHAAPVPAPRVPAADRVGVGLAARRRAVARRPRVAGHRVGRRPVRPVGGGGGDEPRVGRRRADGRRGGRPLPEAGRAARRRGGTHGRPGRHRRPRPRRWAAGVVPRGAGVPRRRGRRLLLPDVVGGGTGAASRGRTARRERHRGDAASARPAGGRACAGRAAGGGLLPAGRAAGGRRRVPGCPAASAGDATRPAPHRGDPGRGRAVGTPPARRGLRVLVPHRVAVRHADLRHPVRPGRHGPHRGAAAVRGPRPGRRRPRRPLPGAGGLAWAAPWGRCSCRRRACRAGT